MAVATASDPFRQAPLHTLPYQSSHVDAIVATPNAIEMLRQTKPWVRLVAILLFIAAG